MPLPLLLPLLLLLFSLLPFSHTDCVPCRYGASTVTCPQPHGTKPESAMTDFKCLCANLPEYERVLSSCFKNDDLPTTCDANDDSEFKRIREACKSVEVTTKELEKTKTETVEDTVVFTKSVKGGKETTLVESAKGGGVVTWTVTYYTSSSSSSSVSANTVVVSGATNVVASVSNTNSKPEATQSGTSKDSGEGTNNGTVIGASVGAAVGVVLVGIVAVEIRKWLKRAENRRVEEEVKEAIRGVVGYGNADGPAELQEERAPVRVEMPLSEKRYELEG
ncbi:hypothetical protein K440DRAFT_663668 [Wilcoxina mikolae CBS 423.85]|nr:hypothetical protein K440DRAFT_663668 [Wilcoxina mikolae CBS 423.85]